MTRTDVDEVDVHPVDIGDELRKRVQLRFRLPPVVAFAPVPDELPQPVQRHALRLIGFLVRPPCGGDAAAEVLERRLRHLSFEGQYRVIFGRLGVARGGKDAKSKRQCSRHLVKLHWRASLPGEWKVTASPVKTLPSASTSSISTLCWPRGMPTRMMVLL